MNTSGRTRQETKTESKMNTVCGTLYAVDATDRENKTVDISLRIEWTTGDFPLQTGATYRVAFERAYQSPPTYPRVVGPSKREYELRDGTLWSNWSKSEGHRGNPHWFPQASVIQEDVPIVAVLLCAPAPEIDTTIHAGLRK